MSKFSVYNDKVLSALIKVASVLFAVIIVCTNCAIAFCEPDNGSQSETDTEVHDGSDNYVNFDDLFGPGIDTESDYISDSDIVILSDTEILSDTDNTETDTVNNTTDTDSNSGTDSYDPTDTDSDNQTYFLGDVDLDGNVNMLDVVMLQRAVAKLVEFNDAQCINADVNFDKLQNMQDVVLIQKYIAKLIQGF